MVMNEEARMRFLRSALEQKMLSSEDYQELVLILGSTPHNSDKREVEGPPPQAEAPLGENQALAAHLAQCIIDVMKRHQHNTPASRGVRPYSAPIYGKPPTRLCHTSAYAQDIQSCQTTAKTIARGRDGPERKFAFPADDTNSLALIDPLQVYKPS